MSTKPQGETENFSIAELYAMPNKQLGDLLGSVVFILGFDINAARVVHAAAQRLRNLPSADASPGETR